MISSVAWVRRGVAKPLPSKFALSDDELDELREEAREGENAMDLGDDRMDEETISVVKKYNLDDYDDGDDDAFGFLVPPEVADYQKGIKDPDLTPLAPGDESDEEDVNDLRIKDTDAVLVAATTEEDQFSHLNVYVYEEAENNLYIHHDIVLAEFPLAVEWMNFKGTEAMEGASAEGSSNFVAVGTFSEGIEVWNLDMIDVMHPALTLGGKRDVPPADVAGLSANGAKKKKKKQKKKAKEAALKEGSHQAAVMCLSWNPVVSHVLASGSADRTAKLWDLNNATCLHTFSHHEDKVQVCKWHPRESNILLTGAYDKTAAVVDARNAGAVHKFGITADIECGEWNPHRPNEFLVSTEDGLVTCYDILKPEKALWTLNAHSESVTCLSINSVFSGCLATVSTDKSLKIWDISDARPSMLYHNENIAKQLFSAQWNKDFPYLLAIGGAGELEIVDTVQLAAVRDRYKISH